MTKPRPREEFDEQAARAASGKHHEGTRRKFVEGARWMFEQMISPLRLAQSKLATSEAKVRRLQAELKELFCDGPDGRDE